MANRLAIGDSNNESLYARPAAESQSITRLEVEEGGEDVVGCGDAVEVPEVEGVVESAGASAEKTVDESIGAAATEGAEGCNDADEDASTLTPFSVSSPFHRRHSRFNFSTLSR